MMGVASPAAPGPDRASQVHEQFGQVPLYFEQNYGQVSSSASFLARSGSYTLYLEPAQAVFAFSPSANESTLSGDNTLQIAFHAPTGRATPIGIGERTARSYYWLANQNASRQIEARQFERVRYSEIYPGIDAVFYGSQRQLEYDFIVAPGADPSAITLAISGSNEIALDEAGNLRLSHRDGTLTMHSPIAYQQVQEERLPVEAHYQIESDGTVRFHVGEYDSSQPLIIDPVVTYATYFGGSAAEVASDIVVDADSQAVIVGSTRSVNLPLSPNAAQTALAGGRCSGSSLVPTLCFDVFVAKLNAAGTDIVYATYFGGTGDDQAAAATLDADGNAYITGTTRASDFPTTAGAWQRSPTSNGAQSDGFVVKLGPQGNVVYATLLGGSGNDIPTSVAVDLQGQAFVAGDTNSRDFPVTSGTLQAENRSDPPAAFTDAFVTKLNAEGSAAVYSTYLGGRFADRANAIVVDSSGSAWIAGSTASPNFPVTPGVFQTSLNGTKADAFVARLSPEGDKLTFSTYLGGSGDDSADHVASDFPEGVYVAGATDSQDFPATAGANLSVWKRSNGFVAKLNADGSKRIAATYVLGTAEDLARDSSGNIYVSGRAGTASSPLGNPPLESCAGNVLRIFDRTLSQLQYSGFLPALGAIAVGQTGSLYTLGGDATGSLQTTVSAFQQSRSGESDVFVSKLSLDLTEDAAVTCVEHSASMVPGEISPGQIISVFGSGLGPMTPEFLKINASGFIENRLGETRVLFDGTPAPLLYVQWNQVNAVAPFRVGGKSSVRMQVERGGKPAAEIDLPVAASHPGLFTRSATGRGVGAIVNQDGTINSLTNPAPRGSIVSFYGTGQGETTPAGIDGFITPEVTANLPQPKLKVTVSIAQRPADVLYAGAAPGLVAGVFQINARIPEATPVGEAAVNVTIGSNFNRQPVTVVVK